MYIVEMTSESLFLLLSLLHYAHLLYILGVSFTLIDVILLLNMRNVVGSLLKKYSNYKLFLAMEKELKERYFELYLGQIHSSCGILKIASTRVGSRSL